MNSSTSPVGEVGTTMTRVDLFMFTKIKHVFIVDFRFAITGIAQRGFKKKDGINS